MNKTKIEIEDSQRSIIMGGGAIAALETRLEIIKEELETMLETIKENVDK